MLLSFLCPVVDAKKNFIAIAQLIQVGDMHRLAERVRMERMLKLRRLVLAENCVSTQTKLLGKALSPIAPSPATVNIGDTVKCIESTGLKKFIKQGETYKVTHLKFSTKNPSKVLSICINNLPKFMNVQRFRVVNSTAPVKGSKHKCVCDFHSVLLSIGCQCGGI